MDIVPAEWPGRAVVARAGAVVLAVGGVVLTACATGSAGAPSLTDWEPPAAQPCLLSPDPDAVPATEEVVDVDVVMAALDGRGPGHAVFEIRRDSLGTWRVGRVIETTVTTAVESRVRSAVAEGFQAGPPEGLTLGLRVDLGSPPGVALDLGRAPGVRLGSRWVCLPAVRNREHVRQIMEAVGERVGVTGTVVLRMFIEEDGSVDDLRVTRTSGSAALDQAMLDAARSLRFHPAVNGGTYVPVWTDVPFRIESRR